MNSSRTMGSVLLYCIWHWWCSHDDMHLSLQWGCTALINASKTGKVECVKVLLDRGAKINMNHKVSGVIIYCAHAMKHELRVPSIE